MQRPIPSTGELLPVVGLGTWQTFDVRTSEEKVPLKEVLKTLVANGGKVVDSSPMYGRSEEVTGELSEDAGVNDQLFIATKVWTAGKESGIQQMKASLRLLRRRRIELMQVHNLTDWSTHLSTLREWRDQGIVKYIGITHYTESAYPQIEKIMRDEPIDFMQVNYSLGSTRARERLFPLAMEKKIAVLINRPFEEGALFRRFRNEPLPEWAKEADCASWGNIFLKFILAQPAVTCIIPGTSKPTHLLDNLNAAKGVPPNPDIVSKMEGLLKN